MRARYKRSLPDLLTSPSPVGNTCEDFSNTLTIEFLQSAKSNGNSLYCLGYLRPPDLLGEKRAFCMAMGCCLMVYFKYPYLLDQGYLVWPFEELNQAQIGGATARLRP